MTNTTKKERYEVLLEDIDGKFDFLVENISEILKKLEDHDKRFDQIDERFDRVEKRISTLEKYHA